MDFMELLKLSVSNLFSYKVRSFLTMLGIIIGISSVIMMSSLGAGVKENITGDLNKLGVSNFQISIDTSPGQTYKSHDLLTKKDIEASYKKTLENVQDQLSAPSRAFSKVIHNPVVEKTSDAIGNTVARPNLIISGALGAIVSVIVYFIAKRYGYLLSGSETIILFVAGWSIGAVIEYARVGFINNRKNS